MLSSWWTFRANIEREYTTFFTFVDDPEDPFSDLHMDRHLGDVVRLKSGSYDQVSMGVSTTSDKHVGLLSCHNSPMMCPIGP